MSDRPLCEVHCGNCQRVLAMVAKGKYVPALFCVDCNAIPTNTKGGGLIAKSAECPLCQAGICPVGRNFNIHKAGL